MQEKKIKFTDVLFVGLAFFASYFGAGNLIFPPMLGLQSGSNWLSGMIGMLASGVGLPILAIIVLGMCGSVQKISDHVNKKFYTVMIGAIMILCCCVSIPRTAAVGIEMGLQGIWSGAPYLVFVILYKVLVMIVPIVTTIVASFGLDTIVSLTSPWFSFFYPITLVMTILGIFEKKIPNDGAFKGAVYFTVIYAVLDLPHEYGFGFLDPVLNHIPLYGLGFGWIVPAIVGFIVGLIAWKGKGRTET